MFDPPLLHLARLSFRMPGERFLQKKAICSVDAVANAETAEGSQFIGQLHAARPKAIFRYSVRDIKAAVPARLLICPSATAAAAKERKTLGSRFCFFFAAREFWRESPTSAITAASSPIWPNATSRRSSARRLPCHSTTARSRQPSRFDF